MELIGHFIDGEEVPASDGASFDTIDPWTRQPWARVAGGTREDVERAVAAARRAFDQGPWPRLGYERRGRLLHRLGELIEAGVDELARADTTDMGKPVSVMREADVPRAAHNFHFFADHARMRPSEVFPMDSGHHAYVRYDPAGVVAAIAPWNFPLMLETWKVAPALAWGNTVVLKPAEDSPASATLLARLAMEAGFPEGVLNVVHGFGPDAAGQWLTESPAVDRITFTGESATGRAIARAGAGNLAPVSLELGGKGANLVFADADLEVAVPWSLRAIFSNSGQVCLAGSRLFVERGIYDQFIDRFVAAAEAMVLGDPSEAGTQLGPLASETHYRKVTAYLDTIPADGGKILTGGATGDGWFVRPTVAVDLPASARACREEIFGPVVTVTPFDGEDEGGSLGRAVQAPAVGAEHVEGVDHLGAVGGDAGREHPRAAGVQRPGDPVQDRGAVGAAHLDHGRQVRRAVVEEHPRRRAQRRRLAVGGLAFRQPPFQRQPVLEGAAQVVGDQPPFRVAAVPRVGAERDHRHALGGRRRGRTHVQPVQRQHASHPPQQSAPVARNHRDLLAVDLERQALAADQLRGARADGDPGSLLARGGGAALDPLGDAPDQLLDQACLPGRPGGGAGRTGVGLGQGVQQRQRPRVADRPGDRAHRGGVVKVAAGGRIGQQQVVADQLGEHRAVGGGQAEAAAHGRRQPRARDGVVARPALAEVVQQRGQQQK